MIKEQKVIYWHKKQNDIFLHAKHFIPFLYFHNFFQNEKKMSRPINERECN